DFEVVKEREVALSKENATLKRNLLKYEEEQKGNQRVINELTEKSMESAADLVWTLAFNNYIGKSGLVSVCDIFIT
ncbi:hypothetical protein OS493_015313, partial [Desmophyllum pertusum]